jgi:predicted MFS family arabinose efflux permease
MAIGSVECWLPNCIRSFHCARALCGRGAVGMSPNCIHILCHATKAYVSILCVCPCIISIYLYLYISMSTRRLFLALIVMCIPHSDIFVFEAAPDFVLFWILCLYFLVGLSNGVFSTITFGLGPRMVAQEDRESAGAIMVAGLFFGIALGATFGLNIGVHGMFGTGA